jgi:hypothetical protein
MPVVDPMVRRPAQPLHRLDPLIRVPHLDRLSPDPRFHLLADQPRRHRIGVLLHLDRAPLIHPHRLPLQRLQTPLRQGTQAPLFHAKRLPSFHVPPRHQSTDELPVLLSTREIAAAAEQQFLVERLFEAAMALLAVAVLVAAGRIGRLGHQIVMTHQGLVGSRVLLGVALVVNRQRHPVGAMTGWYAAEFPQSVLQTLAEAGETLGEAQRRMLPVRVGQHEVVDHVRERLTRDRHAQRRHVGEVRRPEPTGFMHLAEEDFLGGTVLGFPLPHPPLDRPLPRLPVLARMFPHQPLQQSLGLQRRLALQLLFQERPDTGQRIDAGSPGARFARFAGQLPLVAIFACGLAIHARFHRRIPQRCLPVQV